MKHKHAILRPAECQPKGYSTELTQLGMQCSLEQAHRLTGMQHDHTAVISSLHHSKISFVNFGMDNSLPYKGIVKSDHTKQS